MSNLVEIQGQIEKLQKQANEIKSREFDKTVHEILVMMEAFGITVKDLSSGKSGGAKVKSKKVAATRGGGTGKKKSTSTLAAKYRGPAGETWSGRGLTPRWLAALMAQGKTKEEFAVKS
ncbi:MAG: H-NS histone family protein [Polaromonas sp.]|uniref:H-NS histone family protein n=1 Tax=Polaromonas sp. TaxID=1869339 RepID=UPI0024879D02|nr:H-NS histone family protein [Polaromonas sp.]MDI1270350.1 H-NS histone family protein [Polaromonas sp.]